MFSGNLQRSLLTVLMQLACSQRWMKFVPLASQFRDDKLASKNNNIQYKQRNGSKSTLSVEGRRLSFNRSFNTSQFMHHIKHLNYRMGLIKRSLSTSVIFCKKLQNNAQDSFSTKDDVSISEDQAELDSLLNEDIMSSQLLHDLEMKADSGIRQGHNFLVIQPKIKWGPERNYLTTPDLQLEEAVTLVKTLSHSRVVDSCIYSLKNTQKKFVYGKGTFQNITERIKHQPNIDAVFLSVEMLTGLQHRELEDAWNVKVYDRYGIVLEIFRDHASSKEAKLQIALAEIPYIRSRLRNNVEKLDQQSGRQNYIGGGGETLLEIQQRLLSSRELKIKKALEKLKKKRSLLRIGRRKKHFPIISVVGYTNAGKTSLIRSLTGDLAMHPEDKLFATLDVTNHAGYLPNKMQVLYVDTVGFLSALPHSLIASFSATLEDLVLSDLIVHVRDISHPEAEAQKVNVLKTLSELQVPQHLMENIIEVSNKVDKIKSIENFGESFGVCAIDGTGIEDLKSEIQQKLMKASDIIRIGLDIPMAGPHLGWLYKEATVEITAPSVVSSENMFVVAVLNKETYSKFKGKFGDLESDQ
ncbi:putative GTP-binding protein 6 [Anneissia japonica]|uniref:putative GTP-binding protein 6 n=1 Tax=Anneissia japonica TaxID=1529436 RepID=UPI00142559CE|nr:putative GTP-binding protein 6 [Anneissia japonica]